MMKALLYLLFVLPLLAACGTASGAPSPAQTLVLVAEDIAYDKSALEATAGQSVRLEFSNQGALAHDFTIDEIEVRQEEADHGGHDEGDTPDSDLHLHLEAGESSSFTFTPLQAGSYAFYCSVAGHREAGMTGTLTVIEGSP